MPLPIDIPCSRLSSLLSGDNECYQLSRLLYDDKKWSDLTAEWLLGWTWNTAEGEGVCGNGTQLTLGLVLGGGQPTQGSVWEPSLLSVRF